MYRATNRCTKKAPLFLSCWENKSFGNWSTAGGVQFRIASRCREDANEEEEEEDDEEKEDDNKASRIKSFVSV